MALEDIVMDSTRFSDTLRYTDVKESRKQTENDFKLLRNRIAFLKKEETRLAKEIKKTQELTSKKIEEKGDKNSTLNDRKRRSEDKIRYQEQKSSEIRQKREKHIENVQKIVRERRNKSMMDAKVVKEKSKEITEAILTQKLQENLKKLSSKQKVLMDRKHKTEKQKLEELKNRAVMRATNSNRIATELSKKAEIEDKIEHMSIEEKEIIQRIQVTQLLCKSINEQQYEEYTDIQ